MDETIRIAVHDRREIYPLQESTIDEYVDESFLKKLNDESVCPICDSKMQLIDSYSECHGFGYYFILICDNCGYWMGKNYICGGSFAPSVNQGIIGRIREVPLNSKDISTPELLKYLHTNEHHLTKLHPIRAERFTMDLLKDWFSCEIRNVGGSKDGGVDGYILKNEELTSIIQVKWREKVKCAESISVVRELAGTLLTKGIPNGFVVTTRDHFSKQADNEIASMNQRSISDIGQINIGYKVYNDIIDMINLSHRIISEKPRLEIPGVPTDDIDELFSIGESESLIIDHEAKAYLENEQEIRSNYLSNDLNQFMIEKFGSSFFTEDK